MVKIYRKDIFELADELVDSGEYPSARNILKRFSEQGGDGGGVSTVMRHLDVWRANKRTAMGRTKQDKEPALKGNESGVNPDYPDTPLTLDAKFISKTDYLERVEKISWEIGAIPSTCTLFRRLRFSGHWLTKKEKQLLSLDLNLPIEGAVGSSKLWSKQDIVDAIIVVARNNAMRVPSTKILSERLGHAFRLACLKHFNGHLSAAREAKLIDPYIIIGLDIMAVDGTPLRSEQEKTVYDQIYASLTKPDGRLQANKKLDSVGYCPDIVLDGWLIIEIMMWDWSALETISNPSSRKIAEQYLKRSHKKREAYAAHGCQYIFVEPSQLITQDQQAEVIAKILELTPESMTGVNKGALDLSENPCKPGGWHSLQEIKAALLPLYESTGVFPTTSNMRDAGLVGIEVAIRKIHGGADKVAKLFGWSKKTTRWMPRGYFNDFENVRRAILAIVEPGSNEMPSQVSIKGAYPPGLLAAIYREHGGLRGVAEKLGLSPSKSCTDAIGRAKHGTWNDYSNVLKAVRAMIPDDSCRVPTVTEFRRAGMNGLYIKIISVHGGLDRVAKDLGLIRHPMGKKISATKRSTSKAS